MYLSQSEFRDYLSRKSIEYAAETIEGKRLKFVYSARVKGPLNYSVSWGNKELYRGDDIHVAMQIFNQIAGETTWL
jgi:hypothetical protein